MDNLSYAILESLYYGGPGQSNPVITLTREILYEANWRDWELAPQSNVIDNYTTIEMCNEMSLLRRRGLIDATGTRWSITASGYLELQCGREVAGENALQRGRKAATVNT